jgi:acetyl esterase/lipase
MGGATPGGLFARWFARTVQWSYSGRRDFARDSRGATLVVTNFLTSAFPPTFISVGNGDSLAPQSYALADALRGDGVRVDALFFARDYRPQLPHEYQFYLDSDEGRLALKRSQAFLASLH